MKATPALQHAKLLILVVLLIASATLLPAEDTNAPAAATSISAADQAWNDLNTALQAPPPPPQWQTNPPTDQELEKFRAQRRQLVETALTKSRGFYRKFPQDLRAKQAQEQELELLRASVQLGGTNHLQELDAREAELLKQPNLNDAERFDIRARSLIRKANLKPPGIREAELEKAVAELQKEFPKQSQVYDLLLGVASEAAPDKAKTMVQQVSDSDIASPEAKDRAKALLKKLNRIGSPIELKFTGVDGREVDLAKMKGKVVLVDFWATWCGPCMSELPNVKAAYEKLHPKGFEIVGISFDQSKQQLQSVVTDKAMPWPQYFDGKGWANYYAKEFGIQSIPEMWLVDKSGKLRDINGRDGLGAKVEKLLAEK